jgi:hypothetical protein
LGPKTAALGERKLELALEERQSALWERQSALESALGAGQRGRLRLKKRGQNDKLKYIKKNITVPN